MAQIRFRRRRIPRTPRSGDEVALREVSRGADAVELRRSDVVLFRPRYERIKRLFDIAICAVALPLVLPLIAVCAALVLVCDGRPVLYAQLRTGRGGRRFRMYKFRTMVRDAEERKRELMALNQLSGPDFKIENDPRITPLGGFLRKASLDELPQLWNVLRGDMSIVGPRPTSFAASTYSLWHTERLEVTPGITGLWQVSGRSEIDFDDRVRLDIEYIENRSFLYDLSILGRTITALAQRKGAY